MKKFQGIRTLFGLKKRGGGSNSISPGDRGKQERTLTFSLLKGTHDDP